MYLKKNQKPDIRYLQVCVYVVLLLRDLNFLGGGWGEQQQYNPVDPRA